MNHYETVFILNPVLSEDQVKEAVQKYADIITSNNGELVDQEDSAPLRLSTRLHYPRRVGIFPGDTLRSNCEQT